MGAKLDAALADNERLRRKIDDMRDAINEMREDVDRYHFVRRRGGMKFSDPLPGMKAVDVLYDIAIDALIKRERAK